MSDLNAKELYSVPLSHLNLLTPPKGDTSAKKRLVASTASLLNFKKYTNINPE